MNARIPYYVGAIAAAAALVGIVGYASCGSRSGDADRSAEAVGRGDNDDRSGANDDARGSAPDDPSKSSRSAKENKGASDEKAQADVPATNAPGSRSQQGVSSGALVDGGASSTPPTSNAASGTPVVLKPGLTPGASVGGLEYRYPSGARGPCGCEQSDVCVRSTTGVGAVVDLCLPRPKDCDPLSCGCFSPSPCGSKRQLCSDNDARMGILNCSTRRGAP